MRSNVFKKHLFKKTAYSYNDVVVKGSEELGMFNLGSTIVMLVEMDQKCNLVIKEE